nr:MAG TPA: hypothetical protein [Caudoviricetes sp.]DAV03022.1 MAG TPA: hypothetical protein [Caudoviricetes sp.]
MKAARGLTNLKEIFFYYEKRCYQLEPLSIPYKVSRRLGDSIRTFESGFSWRLSWI